MILANISNLCWVHGQRRRNQSIFSHLLLNSDGYEEGFFIQPPMVKTARTFQFSCAPEIEVVFKTTEFGRPLTVLQPFVTLPAAFTPTAARRAISDLSHKLAKETFGKKPYSLWINSISYFQAQIAEQLIPQAEFRAFDSAEMLMMYERNNDEEQVRQRTAILKACNVAICSNEQVMSQLNHPAKFLLPNCTEFELFQKSDPSAAPAPLFPKAPGSVYIGFTGMMIAERIDFDLLHALFLRFPAYQFIFVGSTNRPELLARLKTYKNFHYIPEVKDDVLSSILHQLDVAIVPDLDNDNTRRSESAKVLDYLACMLPVLGSRALSYEKYGDSVYTAGSVWEFSHTLERLVSDRSRHEPRFGCAIAQQNSWCNQVPKFVDWHFEQEREQARMAQPAIGRLGAIVKAYL